MKKIYTLLAVASLVFVVQASVYIGEVGRCDDALKDETRICKRFAAQGHCNKRNVRNFCQRSCNLCDDDEASPYMRREYRREYLDNIEAVLLGGEKRKIIKAPIKKNVKKVQMIIPERREWNFMDWIRKYDANRQRYSN